MKYVFALTISIAQTIMAHAADQSPPVRITEVPSPNSPVVTFRIMLRAGSINDPAGKEGLNALTAGLIAEGGTKDLTYAQLTERLYPWAATIGAQIDQEVTTFIGAVHRDHLQDFSRLFFDLLLHPRFDPADFQRVKDFNLNYLRNTLRATNDESLGKQALNAAMFKGHPYGNSERGTVQGITSLTLEDVKKYYSNVYTQANLRIGIAGGYSPALLDDVRKEFSTLPRGEFQAVPLPAPLQIKDLEVTVVEKPARAYAVSMGFPISLTRKDKDYYALLVANSYFGEHRTFNGVLMNRLRGDRGLNYGDYSYIEKFTGGLSGTPFPNPNTPLRQQFFSIWLRPIQPENTHFAIRNALFELKNLVEKGISDEDFLATRKFLLNYSKLWVSTLSRRLGYVMDSEFYETGYLLDRVGEELGSITAADVNAAIRKYLHPSDLKIAVVVDEGKAQAFFDALVTNAPSPITYDAPKPQKILDQDRIIQSFPLVVNRANSGIVRAKDLFEK